MTIRVNGIVALAISFILGLIMADRSFADSIVCGPIYDPYSQQDLYVVSRDTWQGSETYAQSLGANLVTIHSAAENAFILGTVLLDFSSGGGPNLSNVPLWIGLYDPIPNDGSGSEHAADFMWADGSASSFRNWNPGQPNNWIGQEYYTSINWDYAQTGNSLGTWNDNPLGGTQGYGGNTDGPYFGIIGVSVPEPSSVGLLLIGVFGLGFTGRRRSKLAVRGLSRSLRSTNRSICPSSTRQSTHSRTPSYPNFATCCLCFLLAMIGSMTGTAGAGMIDVYFIGGGPVTVTGAGVVGSGGDYWNGVTTLGTSGSNIALSNTSDQPTGLSLSYSGAGGDGGPFYSPTPSPNPNLTSTYADSYTGNTPNNVISLALNGLTPSGIYDLYVYDVADYNVGTGRPGVVGIGAANGGASASFDGNGNLSTWVSGSNYVLLSFTASASGALSFSISPSGGNHEVDLNGFQLISLSSVPEPSSVVLLGSGAIVLLGYVQVRRRRSQMTPA